MDFAVHHGSEVRSNNVEIFHKALQSDVNVRKKKNLYEYIMMERNKNKNRAKTFQTVLNVFC